MIKNIKYDKIIFYFWGLGGLYIKTQGAKMSCRKTSLLSRHMQYKEHLNHQFHDVEKCAFLVIREDSG